MAGTTNGISLVAPANSVGQYTLPNSSGTLALLSDIPASITGPTGYTGYTGPSGAAGSQGATGYTGYSGPRRNTTIPANAIVVGGTINVTTAVTSNGSATVAVGLAGTGGSNTSVLAATAKASLTSNAVLNAATTFSAPKKVTGSGGITFTIGTAALTAGVIEAFIIYFVAAA